MAVIGGLTVGACLATDTTNGATDAGVVERDSGGSARKYVGPCRCLRSGSSGSAGVVSQAYWDEEKKDSTTCLRSTGGGCPWMEYKGDKNDPDCYGFDAGGYGFSKKFRCENRLAGSNAE